MGGSVTVVPEALLLPVLATGAAAPLGFWASWRSQWA